jgi:hypothetical protein
MWPCLPLGADSLIPLKRKYDVRAELLIAQEKTR